MEGYALAIYQKINFSAAVKMDSREKSARKKVNENCKTKIKCDIDIRSPMFSHFYLDCIILLPRLGMG